MNLLSLLNHLDLLNRNRNRNRNLNVNRNVNRLRDPPVGSDRQVHGAMPTGGALS